MKYVKIFFAVEFIACSLLGISQYINTLEVANLFASIFSLIIAILLLRSACKKKRETHTNHIPQPVSQTTIQPVTEKAIAKIVKGIFLVIWTLWCIIGIVNNYTHYKAADWIVIIVFACMPYLILWYLTHKKAKKDQKAHQNIILETVDTKNSMSSMPPNPISQSVSQNIVQNESAVDKLETAQKKLDDSLRQLNKALSSGNIVKVTTQLSGSPGVTPPISDTAYIEDDKIIARTDGKEITDDEIPYLIQVGFEENLQAEKESSNPKFHRTAYEEELSFNFAMKYSHEIDTLTEKFESLYQEAYKTNDLSKRILLLNKAIDAFEKAKKFCFSKGKGGTLFFQDTWENLHNSHNNCFSYLDNIQNALDETIYLNDTVIPSLFDLITNNDGILQKDIYVKLPDIDKSLIQQMVKQLESDKKILRIKKGNSYELHILNN